MTAIPGLWIDWDNDGFGTGAYDDCTALVTAASYSRGGTPEITGAAQIGQAVFTLQNPGGLFDPDYAAGPLYGKLRDGVPVWWGANADGTLNDKGATVYGRFAGRITEIAPLPVAGAGSSTPLVEIVCEDPLGWYGRTPVQLSDSCDTSSPCPGATPAGTKAPLLALAAGGTYTDGFTSYAHPGGPANGWTFFPVYNVFVPAWGINVDVGHTGVQNAVEFTVVGDGTLTIYAYDDLVGDHPKLTIYDNGAFVGNFYVHAPGAEVVLRLTGADIGNCTHSLELQFGDDNLGHGSVAYAGSVWVPA